MNKSSWPDSEIPGGLVASARIICACELAQHDDLQGLDPLMDPSARAQYRHHCFRQSSARLGHAIAKATVMRLLPCPSHPPAPPSRDLLW